MRGLTSVATATHPPWERDGRARCADDDRIGALGDEIINRLFLAGLDLSSALARARDESVRARIEMAVAELDDAVKDLRHLLLAILAAGAEPGISSGYEPGG